MMKKERKRKRKRKEKYEAAYEENRKKLVYKNHDQ